MRPNDTSTFRLDGASGARILQRTAAIKAPIVPLSEPLGGSSYWPADVPTAFRLRNLFEGRDALKKHGDLRPDESARNLVLTGARVNPSAALKGPAFGGDKIARHLSKGLRQAGLTKNCVR